MVPPAARLSVVMCLGRVRVTCSCRSLVTRNGLVEELGCWKGFVRTRMARDAASSHCSCIISLQLHHLSHCSCRHQAHPFLHIRSFCIGRYKSRQKHDADAVAARLL